MGMKVTLTSEHLELLERPSLCSGNGGHQAFFRTLKNQRVGNQQRVSMAQVKQARERLDALDQPGTWQDAYEALLSYFPGH